MRGVAGAYSHRLFVSVQREGVTADVVAPEITLEIGSQCFGLPQKLFGMCGLAEFRCHTCRRDLCRVDVSLNFDDGDGTVRKASIAMEDGVVAIFPALIGEA